MDHLDPQAIQLGAFDGQLLVGGARLCLHQDRTVLPAPEVYRSFGVPAPVVSFSRLFVLPAARKSKLPRQLNTARPAYA